jgi:hypothetical protein
VPGSFTTTITPLTGQQRLEVVAYRDRSTRHRPAVDCGARPSSIEGLDAPSQ